MFILSIKKKKKKLNTRIWMNKTWRFVSGKSPGYRSQISPIWNYFDKVNNRKASLCRTCGALLKGVVTGNAEIHLRSKHCDLFEEFRDQKNQWVYLKRFRYIGPQIDESSLRKSKTRYRKGWSWARLLVPKRIVVDWLRRLFAEGSRCHFLPRSSSICFIVLI